LYAAIRLNIGSPGARGTAEKAEADIERFGERWFRMEVRRVFAGEEEEVEGRGEEERESRGDIFAAAADGRVNM
jgi:hypothetical protein